MIARTPPATGGGHQQRRPSVAAAGGRRVLRAQDGRVLHALAACACARRGAVRCGGALRLKLFATTSLSPPSCSSNALLESLKSSQLLTATRLRASLGGVSSDRNILRDLKVRGKHRSTRHNMNNSFLQQKNQLVSKVQQLQS